MKPPTIEAATEDNRQQVIQALLIGFSTDPLGRWCWPDAAAYLASAPMFEALGGAAFANNSAYVMENYEGAALWLPPGEGPDEEALVSILETTVAEDRQEDAFAVFEAMDSYHPEGDCWYLPVIAVDPFYRGNGFGSSLMKHALVRVDEEGLPAYLVSSNPRNISLYERHGFEIMGEIRKGSSPVVTPMIRQARAS